MYICRYVGYSTYGILHKCLPRICFVCMMLLCHYECCLVTRQDGFDECKTDAMNLSFTKLFLSTSLYLHQYFRSKNMKAKTK